MVINSGTNGTLGLAGGLSAVTVHGGDATVVNSGTNFEGGIAAVAQGGNASVTNSGTNTGTFGANGIAAVPLVPAMSP